MEDALRLQDSWHLISPEDGVSTEPVDPAKSRKARALIRQCCGDDAQAHLVGTTTAKEAWDALKTVEAHIGTRQSIMRDATKTSSQPKWDECIAALRADEAFDEVPLDDSNQNPNRSSNKQNANSPNPHKFKVCFKCAKPNHLASDCRTVKDGQSWAQKRIYSRCFDRDVRISSKSRSSPYFLHGCHTWKKRCRHVD